jgi:indolepyruvate ferredoxin oxidoreductase beta subunit
MITSTTRLVPAIVTSNKKLSYPKDAIGQIRKRGANLIAIEADKIAAELGNPRLVNTILLGALSNYLPFDQRVWDEVIKAKVKERFIEVNLKALARGREIKLEPAGA